MFIFVFAVTFNTFSKKIAIFRQNALRQNIFPPVHYQCYTRDDFLRGENTFADPENELIFAQIGLQKRYRRRDQDSSRKGGCFEIWEG